MTEQTAPLDLEALAATVARMTEGEWAYGLREYDDWGVVRAGDLGIICQARDPINLDRATLNRHRIAGTDPWEANAAGIVALKNAAPALIAETQALRERVRVLEAENARLREAMTDIERRCAARLANSPNGNLYGRTPAAKKAGTIRNVRDIARAALSGE
jgi:hypothetical protein